MSKIDQLTRGADAFPGSSLDNTTGSWRSERPVHHHAAAPCRAACPAGEDPQDYLARLDLGDAQGAWESLVRKNPLPAITGRVCPHPCESACSRGRYDSPLAVHAVERWLGDEALRRGFAYPLEPAREGARLGRAAIVGAGPAGLSAAYQLRRLGHAVTLIEKLPLAGGLLRSAIPHTRLPRDVLEAELERLLALGIELQTRTLVGRDLSVAELRADHDAVFLGPGCEKEKHWDVDGAVPGGHHNALHLQKEYIAVGAVPTPKSAVIHGGGNTAVDLARAMKRAGVAEVHVITASGLPGPGADPRDVLNVVPREYDEAVEEGVVFHPHRTIARLILRGSKVMGLEMVRLRKVADATGRARRAAFEGTETLVHAEMVISAIGEVVEPHGFERWLGGRPYFAADPFGLVESESEGGLARVYVGGDARGDRGTVAAAIGDGRRAALAIDAALQGTTAQGDTPKTLPSTRLNLRYFEHAPRREAPPLPVAARTGLDEIEGSLEAPDARAEAKRCLSCGNCMACDNCWTLCPDRAVVKLARHARDGTHYAFDYDFCKGCGICAAECPTGFIDMQNER